MQVDLLIKNSVADFCWKIGSDHLLVQGAGGNVSWKDGNVLWVKASGKWLSEAKSRDIFVPIDLIDTNRQIELDNFKCQPKILGDGYLRPSIETFLHALMPQKFVVHLHAVEVLAYLVRCNAEKDLALHLEGSGLSWAFISYNKPGEKLAFEIKNTLTKQSGVDILFLESHGVVIAGNDLYTVETKISQLTKILSSLAKAYKSVDIDLIESKHSKYKPVKDPNLHNLAIEPSLFCSLKECWGLYPDHVVFLGKNAVAYRSWGEAQSSLLPAEVLPDIIFIENTGAFVTTCFDDAKLAQLRCYYEVLIRQPDNVNLKILSDGEIDELLNWEAEKYRSSLLK